MENNQTIKFEIEDVLILIKLNEIKYPDDNSRTIIEIVEYQLDVEWESFESEIISEIYDNKQKSIEEIKSIISDFKIQKLNL